MTVSFIYLKRVQVNVEDLQVGMHVCELDRPWEQSSFLLQGFDLHNEADIQAVQQQCEYVYIDFPGVELYQHYLESIKPDKPTKASLPQEKTLQSLSQELPRAKAVFSKATVQVKTILQQIVLGEAFDEQSLRNTVAEIVDSILVNEDALMVMLHLREKHEHVADHSLRVTITSVALGRYIGLNLNQLNAIGICAMLHDVGQVDLPDELLNPCRELSVEEQKLVQDHARRGYEILLKLAKVTPAAVDVAYSHHERLDGSGYPRALTGDQIHFYARLVAIIDTYDTLTNERLNKDALSPLNAFRVLMRDRGSKFDDELSIKFVEWMGVYPVGSIVELQTGEIGIVVSVDPHFKLRPKVLLVTDDNKQPRDKENVLNLREKSRDDDGYIYTVRNTLADGAFGIRVGDFVRRGLRLAY